MVKEKTSEQKNTNTGVEKKKGVFGKLMENKVVYGLLAFLLAMAIIFLVLGSAFYLVVKNNVNGMGEKYRKNLQGVPVIKWALPQPPDPEDPKYMTFDELAEKYNALKKENQEQSKKLGELSASNAELQLYKNSEDKVKAEGDAAKKDLEAQNAQLEQKKKELTDERKKLDEIIASGDKVAFKDFYEKMDKENAQRIYTAILSEQKVSEEAKKFAQLYETMDPSAAAKIFEQMGTAKMDLVVDILRNMKKESAAEVLASMTPAYASKVSEKLSKFYLNIGNQGS